MKRQIQQLIEEYRKHLPLEESVKKKLNEKFRLEFNFNSNHLEGNTLTYGETKLLLIFDQTKGNHELREYEEMKAHDVALKVVMEEATDERPLTEVFIKELNKIILVRNFWKDAITEDGQDSRKEIQVGQYKQDPNHVRLANGEIFEYASPEETPMLMGDLVRWFNEESQKGELTTVELAALLHYKYIRIHPFDDGNGRVARLLVNYVLFRDQLPPVIIKTDDKKNYLRALQQADAGDLQAFIDYMTHQLAWSLDLATKAAKGESIEEEDDWEKELKLLQKSRKETNLKDKNKIVIQNFLLPLIGLYSSKLIQFDTLFYERFLSLKIQEKEIINILDDKPSFDEMSQKLINEFLSGSSTCSHIEVELLLSKLKKPFIESAVVHSTILITFDTTEYHIKYNNNNNTHYSFSYFERITEEIILKLISEIGKYTVTEIKKYIKKNESY